MMKPVGMIRWDETCRYDKLVRWEAVIL